MKRYIKACLENLIQMLDEEGYVEECILATHIYEILLKKWEMV